MDRSATTRTIAGVVALSLAFVGTVITLNLTLYSASDFVGSYLSALARKDIQGALVMPGVEKAGTETAGAEKPSVGERALLNPLAMPSLAMPSLTDVRLVKDSTAKNGTHTVVYSYRVNTTAATSSFEVAPTTATFGVFSAWRFTKSPLSTLSVTALHGTEFSANDLPIVATAASTPVSLLVLTPSSVKLSHHSLYLTAATTHTLVSTPGTIVPAIVDIQANTAFVTEVRKALNKDLADCVTQKVLLPTGCPMGQQIRDRMQNTPTWTMVNYPEVKIVAGAVAGSWEVPRTKAVAHVSVTVKSIFDGSISHFSKDVPFTVGYTIALTDTSIAISAQY